MFYRKFKTNHQFSGRLYDSIENYYSYNPDTLMPLLMVALASQGNLSISDKDSGTVFCSLEFKEIIEYDWVKLDPSLRKRLKLSQAKGESSLKVIGKLEASLKEIHQTFNYYDTYTVEQEYHHRIGILYNHSRNEACEKAFRKYAMFCLAETLLNLPTGYIKRNFLQISNHILTKSGLQPDRPRLRVAQTLCALLDYNGSGIVYNPFAGCAFAAAMIEAGDNLYADGDRNDKIFSAARLLNYGMGGSCKHFEQRDSTKWFDGERINYVISTYRGYINGKSAFDFCLSKCFNSLAEDGKFAGIVSPKDIFETQSEEMKEALKRDWIDSIVLLPFGEVAVLVNAKKASEMRKRVRFYNLNHAMLRHRPIAKVLSDDSYAVFFRTLDVKKKCFLKNFIIPEIPERDGSRIVKLGSIVSKMRKKTYSLNRVSADKRVLAYINRKHPYDMFNGFWMNDIKKKSITSLFAPSYHLTRSCLITNSKGALEPRLFDPDQGTAYFQDGFAFTIDAPFDEYWLITQLNEPYVQRQLHPYGMDEMIPETITEEQILKLSLYQECEDQRECSDFEGQDLDADSLPSGFELKGEHTVYTIHKFLGHGNFGYAYSASSYNVLNGEEKEVVLKEFYPFMNFHREGEDYRAVANEYTNFNIGIEREKFCDEAKIMRQLGHIPDSHIVPAQELFKCEKTDTLYYVMPFYQKGSLEDLQNAGMNFNEELVIKNIVVPLCTALHIAHANMVLHLDIKPENVLVDKDGYASLTDFGVAKQYDDEGSILNRAGLHATSDYAAPEMRTRLPMIKFGPEPDIFGLSATLYNIMTKRRPHSIQYKSDDDCDLRQLMKEVNISEKFIDAIIAGLQAAATSRPANAQAFLNMFPGCENIKLTLIR